MSGCCAPVIVPAGGGGGGGGPGKTTAVVTLVDGNGIAFLRHIVYDVNGAVQTVTDTDLSGTTPYVPAGDVTPWPPAATTPPQPEPQPQLQIIEQCSCDDANGDGIPDTDYLELFAVDATGQQAPRLIGTYLGGDLAEPYTPVSPVPCGGGGQPPIPPDPPVPPTPPQVEATKGVDPNGVVVAVTPADKQHTYSWDGEPEADVPADGAIPERVLTPGTHTLKVCVKGSVPPVCTERQVTVPIDDGGEPDPPEPPTPPASDGMRGSVHRNPGDPSGLTVDVYAANGLDGSGPVRITWSEGEPPTGTSPGHGSKATTHTYPGPGEKTITLTDVDDPSRTATITATLPLPATPPPMTLTVAEDPRDATRMTAIAYPDNQGAGDVRVDTGDGIAETSPGTGVFGTVRQYAAPGTFTITATDLDDGTRSATQTVTLPFTG